MNTGTSKIFGIGLSKTGTTSLARALEILGYRTRDYLGITRYAPGDLSSVDLQAIDANDAFTDTPIPSFYRELDAAYPGSRFILTIRDREGWLKSCKKQFNQKLADKQNDATRQLFIDLYGTNVFDEEKFAAGYDRFVAGVKEYFRDRPGDLLVLNLTAGEGWEQLCPFLGKEIPDIPFPRANVTRIRWMDIGQLASAAREATDQMARAIAPPEGEQAAPRGFLQRLGSLVTGGGKGRRQRAVKKARKIVLDKLEALNPEIPVVLSDAPLPDYSQRRNWNHFWLVDLVDGGDTLLAEEPPAVFSIALIEDRKPIMGVIGSPRQEVVCYATAGKPAARTVAEGEAQPLALAAPERECGDLRACLVAGSLPGEATLQDTTEWETAAAQVILDSAGHVLKEKGADQPLVYNKKTLRNPPLVLREK